MVAWFDGCKVAIQAEVKDDKSVDPFTPCVIRVVALEGALSALWLGLVLLAVGLIVTRL